MLLLKKTYNTTYDKQIALFELKRYYINHKCRNNTYIKKMGINLCKLFLENKYIIKIRKKLIKNFLQKLKINWELNKNSDLNFIFKIYPKTSQIWNVFVK